MPRGFSRWIWKILIDRPSSHYQMLELWIFLPAVVLAGIATSYTDICYHKIRNNWIIGCLAYAIIARLILFAFGEGHLLDFSLAIAISAVLGIAFWLNCYWAAADAKMYIALSALFPLGAVSEEVRLLIPVYILAFSFTAAFAMQLVGFLKRVRLVHFTGLFEKTFELKSLILTAMIYLSIQWPISYVTSSLSHLLTAIVMMVLPIGRIKRLVPFLILVIVAVFRLALDSSVFALSFLLQFMAVLLLFRLLKGFFKGAQHNVFVSKMDVMSLMSGMVLQKGIARKDGKPLEVNASCLSDMDIKLIRRSSRKGEINNEVEVAESTFFAPYLLIGTLLALIVKGFYA
jgi:hypothetical protein